jgi:hypothetical protein
LLGGIAGESSRGVDATLGHILRWASGVARLILRVPSGGADFRLCTRGGGLF